MKKQFADSGRRVLGLRQRLRVPLRRSRGRQEEHRDCKQFVDLVQGPRRQGRQGPAQRRAQGVTREKTFEQIGKALTSAARPPRTPASKSGSRSTGRHASAHEHARPSWKPAGTSPSALTWNSNPTDVENGSVTESFELLKPWIRSCHINDLENDANGQVPVPRAVQALPGDRLRPLHAVRGRQGLQRGRGDGVSQGVQGAVGQTREGVTHRRRVRFFGSRLITQSRTVQAAADGVASSGHPFRAASLWFDIGV